MKYRIPWLLLLCLCPAAPVFSGDLPGLEEDDNDPEWSLEEGGDAKAANDFERLARSHLSRIAEWEGVQPTGRRKRGKKNGKDKPYHWRVTREGVAPTNAKPIRTKIRIPATGEYRIYLRLRISPKRTYPIKLELRPTESTEVVSHEFGKITLSSALTGKAQEKELPLRFESELQLIGFTDRPVMVWQYWDCKLTKGTMEFRISSSNRDARADALFISASKTFLPSLADYAGPGRKSTLDRVYLRFKLLGVVDWKKAPKNGTYDVGGGARYHWGRPVKGKRIPVFGWKLGSIKGAPVSGWSEFLDCSEALIEGGGPWSSGHLGFKGVKSGKARVELAWFPHEGAVLAGSTVKIRDGRAMLRLPHRKPRVRASSTDGAWGMASATYIGRIKPWAEIVKQYDTFVDEAEKRLGIKPDHPRTRAFRLIASGHPEAWHTLARTGINWIPNAPRAIKKKFNLFDETTSFHMRPPDARWPEEQRARHTRHKHGDEIHTHIGTGRINGDRRHLQAFHAYLTAQAKALGLDNKAFLGMEDFSCFRALGKLPHNAGLYERRLFYASQRFAHLAGVSGRRRYVAGYEKNFPNVLVYNNYSPHPVFLTGSTMNSVDWFVLCRNKAQTLGWGEDWAWCGTSGLFTGAQCTSYYAALVACSTRKHGYPGGFYAGVNCTRGAQKIFSCISHGLNWITTYDWGPLDYRAEGSNFWSERKSSYYDVMAASCALGPADDIFTTGKREQARTAILYNRSHEIWYGGKGRMNHDWMWYCIALRNRQIPTDVIIEEDLNDDALKNYKVVAIGGFNLERRHLAALRRWVEAGGVLIGMPGAALYDNADDVNPDTAKLFGAEQKRLRPKPRKRGEPAPPSPEVHVPALQGQPEVRFTAVDRVHVRLKPAGGKVIASFADGSPAAVENALGKGRTLLYAFQPGHTYTKHGGKGGTRIERKDPETGEMKEVRTDHPLKPYAEWLTAPVFAQLGRQRVEYSAVRTESTVFESDKGLAVMLASYAIDPPETARLSVKVGRTVKEVSSTLRGKLEWTEKDGRIEVTVPQLKPVDVIVFR